MTSIASRLIWKKGALDHVPEDYRAIYHFYLPYIDTALIAFGIFGITVGSKVVTEFTLAWFPLVWAIAILTAAAVALVGLGLQLKRTEFAGKLVLIGCLVIYGIMLIFNITSAGSFSSVLTIIIVSCLLAGITLRTIQLGNAIADEDVANGKK